MIDKDLLKYELLKVLKILLLRHSCPGIDNVLQQLLVAIQVC